MASSETLWSTLKRRILCCFYYLFYWVDCERGGGRLNCKLKFWMVKRENMNESGPARIEVGPIFLSKFCVKLPWTTSSPPEKGDYHVFSDTGFIRHGAVVCRIVNWKQLTAYKWQVLRISGPNFVYGFCGPQEKIVSYLFSILSSGGERSWGGGGGRWNCYCEMWIFNIVQFTIRPE